MAGRLGGYRTRSSAPVAAVGALSRARDITRRDAGARGSGGSDARASRYRGMWLVLRMEDGPAGPPLRRTEIARPVSRADHAVVVAEPVFTLRQGTPGRREPRRSIVYRRD